ncbi:MAG: hypothetical protein JJU05_06300 [Verrucomicrobia bacterium]|nr:hypothetical protein [Verrucomicrobiota bacterium]MCH8525748.1 hypothetical protein [Kiritimatiellia bacterium]
MKSVFLTVLFLFMFRMLSAQEGSAPVPTPDSSPTPTPAPRPESPPVQVEFSVFVWPTEGILMEDSRISALPRTFYRTAAGHVPVRLTRNSTTPLYTYRGPSPLVLYDIEEIWTPPPEDAPPETEPTVELRPVPVIRANFPGSWTRVLLIVFPDRKADDGTLLTIPLPYNLDRLRPGMARIHNGSDRTLLVEFPDTEHLVTLEPFQPVDFNPRGLSGSGFTRVFVHQRNDRGDIEMVHTSRLFMDPETTNYFFLYPQGRRRIRLLRVAGHPGED